MIEPQQNRGGFLIFIATPGIYVLLKTSLTNIAHGRCGVGGVLDVSADGLRAGALIGRC
jgi:hypothetical protein